METSVDILAAKLTGIKLAKMYTSDELYVAMKLHPEVRSLREGWITAFVTEFTAPPKPIPYKASIVKDAAQVEKGLRVALALCEPTP